MYYKFHADQISGAYSEAVYALRRLALSEGLDTAQRAVADALADLVRDWWAQMTGAKQSRAQVPHWRRLIGEKPDHAYLDRWEDHISLWNREGRPWAYVSQPYVLGTGDLRAIVTCCDENELTADVRAEVSWHFPGRTTSVCLRSKPDKARPRFDDG